ncbi:MAG: ABC transporter permease [Patescibacteria group bacterium]|nr:ABC transporter permease [Patescibacteria group bacterium]
MLDTVRIALQGISTHKSRAVLTMLGIIIGVTSVMTVISAGESAQAFVVAEISSFGPTNIFVLPGRQPSGPQGAAGTLLNDSLKERDVQALEQKVNVPQAKQVIPYIFGFKTLTVDENTYDSMVIGSSEQVAKNFDLSVAQGAFFTQDDVNNHTRVVVIGETVREELFGSSNPIGQKIKVGNIKLQVIGVLGKKGQASFFDANKAVLVPYTVVQQDILGIKYFQRLIVEADTVQDVPGVIADITTTLRMNHNITDPAKDDFFIRTQGDLIDQISTITTILTVLLLCVAAISLLVGGVGIMNIMLVSVTERTKEIGLRKALGATNSTILQQFLYEALALTLGGGIIGVGLGTALTKGISWAAQTFAGINFPYIFSIRGLLVGVGVSVAIGLLFGIFPARSAAKKNPVESLYSE